MKFIGILVPALIMLSSAAYANGIFYVPLADQITPRGFLVDPDYQQLFQPQAPWPVALHEIKVFGIGPNFASTGPEEELGRLFTFLDAHGIGLSVEWPVVTATECGANTEGINHGPRQSTKVAQRIKSLGGKWSYIVSDAALQAGHYRTQSGRGEPHGCQYPIAALAKNVADNVRQIEAVFPGVELIDQEPLTAIKGPEDVRSWVAALRRELGPSAPTVMQFDVQWRQPWQDTVRWIIPTLQQLGMGYGVIFNGDAGYDADGTWTAAAKGRIAAWERATSVDPVNVVFEGWDPHPGHVLPENDPTTILSLIGWYCSHSTHRVGCGAP